MADEKIALITGANSGIGKVLAEELARAEMRVVLACRKPQAAEMARIDITRATNSEKIEVLNCDLASLQSIRNAVETFSNRHPKLDVLINNAGIYLPTREQSADGFELTFATNHLGPYLLTRLLLNKLAVASPSRIVNVTSAAHFGAKVDFDDIQAEHSYKAFRQYSNTKLMNIWFTRSLARRVQHLGITVNCFHPGTVATDFAQDRPGLMRMFFRLGKPFMRTPQQGALIGLYLAMSSHAAGITGEYFEDERPKVPSRAACDETAAEELWRLSERYAQIK